MNLRKLTIIICIIWITIISVWVIRSEYILNTGREVLLKTIPVDPRDLLMGDYVILNYDISQLPESDKYLKDYPQETVYVILKTDKNNIASIERIHRGVSQPDAPLYLRGRISKCNNWQTGACINYGIESYYVKENTGRELENNLRNGALVKVSIDHQGNAKVKGFVNKK